MTLIILHKYNLQRSEICNWFEIKLANLFRYVVPCPHGLNPKGKPPNSFPRRTVRLYDCYEVVPIKMLLTRLAFFCGVMHVGRNWPVPEPNKWSLKPDWLITIEPIRIEISIVIITNCNDNAREMLEIEISEKTPLGIRQRNELIVSGDRRRVVWVYQSW